MKNAHFSNGNRAHQRRGMEFAMRNQYFDKKHVFFVKLMFFPNYAHEWNWKK